MTLPLLSRKFTCELPLFLPPDLRPPPLRIGDGRAGLVKQQEHQLYQPPEHYPERSESVVLHVFTSFLCRGRRTNYTTKAYIAQAFSALFSEKTTKKAPASRGGELYGFK